MTRGEIPLYRGIKKGGDILYGDSSNIERKSSNTTNHYTLLFSEILSSWQNYPKRNRSFICTSDKSYAQEYGSLYSVFPVGDPILGICPRNDMWHSFSSIFSEITVFNRMLEQIADMLDISTEVTKENLLNLFNRIDKLSEKDIMTIMSNFGVRHQQYFLHNFMESDYETFLDYIDNVMSPEKNHFERISFSQYIDNYTSFIDREIWFSGPSFFMISDH